MFVPVFDNSTSTLLYSMMPPVLGWIGALVGAATGLGSLFKKHGDTIGKVGGILGGAAQGSQQGRLNQDFINAKIYDSAMQGALGQGDLDLKRKKFELDAGGQRTANVGRASLMNNVQDFSMGGPGQGEGASRMGGWTNTGGMRPSALGPEAKEAANLLIARELAALKSGEKFADIKFPETPQLSKAGWLEKVMGGAGLGGSILGGIFGGKGGAQQPVGNDLPQDGGITGNQPWGKYTFLNPAEIDPRFK